MLIQCKHCGAPLDVREGRSHAKCRYCGFKSRVASTKTIAPTTPKGWTPPKTWTPPDDASTTSTPLHYHRTARGVMLIPLLVAGGAAITGVLVSVMAASDPPTGSDPSSAAGAQATLDGPAGVAPAELAHLSLAGTPGEVAEAFGVEPDEDGSVTLPLRGRYEYVRLRWGDDPQHVEYVLFYASEPIANAPAILGRFATDLGRRWEVEDGYGSYGWGSMHLSAHADGTQIGGGVGSYPGPYWRAEMEALWLVMRRAVLGLDLPLEESTRRDRLGLGYPLATLADLDLQLDIDRTAEAMPRLYPGAARSEERFELTYEVPMDHPLVSHAWIQWNNAPDAKPNQVELWAQGEAFPDAAAIASCLTAALGEPEERVSDHLAQERNWSWGQRASLSRGHLSINIESHWVERMSDESFDAAVRALDACGT